MNATVSALPLSNLQYRTGSLHVDAVDIKAISRAVGTPFYLYSRDRMLGNLKRLQAAFPTAEIHYSLKANANLALIRALLAQGAGVDAVSGGEVYKALHAGANPQQIVLAGVGKTAAELQYALEAGVGWINVESAAELERLQPIAKQIATATGRTARVALRLNPNVQADTHHYIATGHAAAKFGISLEAAQTILAAHDPQGNVRIAGLHVHIGSQLGTVERTIEAIQAVLPFYDQYPYLTALNIGGGFPVSYTGEPIPPVEQFAEAIQTALQGRSLHLMLEPGRYIVADAGLLIVAVQYLKPSPEGLIVVTDGGMTELIRPALYSATHAVLTVNDPSHNGGTTAAPQLSHVVGPVCESADVLRTSIMLPPLAADDLLAVLHVGAYGAVMGSTYNARPRPPEVLVEGDTWRIIRRRETWEDLIRLEE